MYETNYHLDTWRKKLLYSLGLLIAFFYAIFCGISLAGYVILTFGTGGGALIGAVVGALVCTAANFKTSITKIPEVLVDFFGGNNFFANYFEDTSTDQDPPRSYLRYQPWYKQVGYALKRNRKKIALGIGIILSLLAGLAIFGQGYGGITVGLMAFAGLTAATTAISGIGLFGAIIFFIAFWAITLKAIILELQKRGWFEQCKKFISDLFDVGGECQLHPHNNLTFRERMGETAKGLMAFCRNPSWQALRNFWTDLTHTCMGQHKSKLRTYAEGTLIVLMLTAIAPLAVLGVVTAMMASHIGILKFVTDTWPTVSEHTMNVISGFSWVLVVGLASLGQLPFYLKTTMNTFKRLGKWALYNAGRLFGGASEAAYETSEQLSFSDKAMYAVRLVNAGYSALYSYVGGGADHSFLSDAGAVGGVINSFGAPEKIGGTGFSDIWRNFKAQPGGSAAPAFQRSSGGQGWDEGLATSAVASGGDTAAMYLPLLYQGGGAGGSGASRGRASSYQTMGSHPGGRMNYHNTVTRQDDTDYLPLQMRSTKTTRTLTTS